MVFFNSKLLQRLQNNGRKKFENLYTYVVSMNYTLTTWQSMVKPKDNCIVQASSTDGKDTWQPFPIGMGGHWMKYKEDVKIQQGPHTELLYVALNPTSDKGRRGKLLVNRQTILSTLAKKGFYNQFTTPKDYFYSLPHYKFVASPEGNGIDCHRHVEAIFAGCIPIVEDHPGIREKYEGLPVLYTTTFQEITRSYLQSKYESMKEKTYDFSKLYIPFYTDEQQKAIQECSSYWLSK